MKTVNNNRTKKFWKELKTIFREIKLEFRWKSMTRDNGHDKKQRDPNLSCSVFQKVLIYQNNILPRFMVTNMIVKKLNINFVESYNL